MPDPPPRSRALFLLSPVADGLIFRFRDVLYGFDLKRRPFHSYRSIGRHPHADRRSLQPASADALSGGKGLPPYFYQVNEGCSRLVGPKADILRLQSKVLRFAFIKERSFQRRSFMKAKRTVIVGRCCHLFQIEDHPIYP